MECMERENGKRRGKVVDRRSVVKAVNNDKENN
jgi:hypothetical protein